MSHTITLDTLEYANQLKSVGVPDKQAEKFATLEKKRTDEICAFIDNSLATKKDIEDLKQATKHDIAIVKRDIIIWLGSINIIALVAVTSILGYLIKH